MASKDSNFLVRAHRFFFLLGIFYAFGIFVLSIPWVQRHASYQYVFRWPLFADFATPEKYGLAPGKTLNVRYDTPDNVTLGAWFVLSDSYYQTHQVSPAYPSNNLSPAAIIKDAIASKPTILFLHGTAGTRATASRIRHYSTFTTRLDANVLVVDYRGFGDSHGLPSETGLETDAYASWKWLLQHGAKQEDILVLGHSLGTGVASKLGRKLALEGSKPRGIALLAPFTSFAVLLEDYPLFGVPILQPLQSFGWGRKLIKMLILERYDTLSIIQDLNVPVLIAHASSDEDIPHTHSHTLIDNLLNPLLPPSASLPAYPGETLSAAQFEQYKQSVLKRKEARALLVRRREVKNFGVVEEFDGKYGQVVYVETFWGGHDMVGAQEGVQDEIGRMFGLGVGAANLKA